MLWFLRPVGVLPAAGGQSSVPCQSLRCCGSGYWDGVLVSSHVRSGDRHAGARSEFWLRKLNRPTGLLQSAATSPRFAPPAGGGAQEGSVCDGAGRPSVPAHGSADHPCTAGPGEDDPLGGLYSEAVAEVHL